MRIGIDMGGTKIEGIALADSGEELLRIRIKSPRHDYEATVEAITGVVRRIEAETDQKGTVGIGIPGAISPQTGLVKNANSTWIIGRQFDVDLERAMARKIRLANDANCLAVSEAVDGAGAGAKVVFAIIIGTGCGGGIAIDQKVHGGLHSIAGEWGHISLGWMRPEEYPGVDCYCGQRGCLETFISGTGFENEYEKQTGVHKSGREIAQLLEQNDADAEKVTQIYENRLARAIATAVNIIDPDVLVLGGGMSNLARLYKNLPALVQKWTFGGEFTTPIRPAKHGDSSGVRGAAWLW
ncbi:MAG: fructokinase [Proteobacteria bacterium]|jgi:fructokinase|nr:fructokinase [Pseudomonadota bacterium]MBT5793430.1 fructokinase [Deltaproteobacteria bacterium]MDB3917194.1 fructokinase [bacterium]